MMNGSNKKRRLLNLNRHNLMDPVPESATTPSTQIAIDWKKYFDSIRVPTFWHEFVPNEKQNGIH